MLESKFANISCNDGQQKFRNMDCNDRISNPTHTPPQCHLHRIASHFSSPSFHPPGRSAPPDTSDKAPVVAGPAPWARFLRAGLPQPARPARMAAPPCTWALRRTSNASIAARASPTHRTPRRAVHPATFLGQALWPTSAGNASTSRWAAEPACTVSGGSPTLTERYRKFKETEACRCLHRE